MEGAWAARGPHDFGGERGMRANPHEKWSRKPDLNRRPTDYESQGCPLTVRGSGLKGFTQTRFPSRFPLTLPGPPLKLGWAARGPHGQGVGRAWAAGTY